MIGTTSQWWRAFLYLGALTTVRGEIATYIEPWVDKISHQLDANLSAIDDATFFCMPATMGVVIYLDGILTKIVGCFLRIAWVLLFAIAWLSFFVLARAEATGKCPPCNSLTDVVACGPIALEWAADFVKPVVDTATPWVNSVRWISLSVWFLGAAPWLIPPTVIVYPA